MSATDKPSIEDRIAPLREAIDAVDTQQALVTVNAQGALVLGQDLVAAGLFGSGFTAGQVAVAAFIVAGAAVLVAGEDTTGTTAK